jgi:hypothetical protein
MAITSYATLLTEAAGWLHRGTSLDTVLPGLVQFAEARIYRDLRIRAMETALSGTIAAGVLAVPSGYIELKHARIDGSSGNRLTRKDAEWIYANYPTRSADSQPKFIAREGESFIFGPYPDTGYTVKGSYYKRLPALSASNTTNWFITDAPELLLFATLCEAEPYLVNDPRIALWEKKYQQIKDRIQLADEQEEFSGSPLFSTVR